MLTATSSSVVLALLTAMRSTARSRQREPLVQAVPSASIRSTTAHGLLVAAEGHAHLGEHDVVEHLGAGDLRHGVGEGARVPAHPVDHLGDARASRGAQRRPHGHPAGTAGHLRDPVHRVARGVRDEVVALRTRRRVQRRRVADRDDAAVVGHVQRLVRVGRPGVGELDARCQVAVRRARRLPTTRTRRRRAPRRRARARRGCTPRTGRTRRSAGCPPAAATIVGWSGADASALRRASGRILPSSSESTSSAAGRPTKPAGPGRPTCAAPVPRAPGSAATRPARGSGPSPGRAASRRARRRGR